MVKKNAIRTFVPMSAVAAAFGMAASAANGTLTPVFEANFPASWNGTSTTVTDQYGTSNVGFQSGTATYTTSIVPPGATAGTGSMAVAGAGGIKITPAALLNNSSVASAGGFTLNMDFMWDGTDSTVFGHVEKLISYAGTEDLQLDTTAANGTAILEMVYNVGNLTTGGSTTPAEVTANSTTIAANTWYNVELSYNTTGNAVDSTGDVTGVSSMYVDGSLISSTTATKGSYGDSLNRPIAIGEWGYGHTTSTGGLHGDIYDASVQLGVVPEPGMLGLAVLGGLALLPTRRRKSR